MSWEKENLDLGNCYFWFTGSWFRTKQGDSVYVEDPIGRDRLRVKTLKGKRKEVRVKDLEVKVPLEGFCYFWMNSKGKRVLNVGYCRPRTSRSYKKGLYSNHHVMYYPKVMQSMEGMFVGMEVHPSIGRMSREHNEVFFQSILKKPKGKAYKLCYDVLSRKPHIRGQVVSKDFALAVNPLADRQVLLIYKEFIVGECSPSEVILYEGCEFLYEKVGRELHVSVTFVA